MTNHVHFKNSEDQTHSGEIVVNKGKNNAIHVQLGILMCEHEYNVSFKIPLPATYSFTGQSHGELSIKDVTLTEEHGETLLKATVLTTQSHGQFNQNVEFSNGEKTVTAVVDFSLMNDQLGTPFLRNGLHCVRRLSTESTP